MEQKVKLLIGELHFSCLILQDQLEAAQKRIKELEAQERPASTEQKVS